ncbi:MAG: hypothetical protein D6768_08845 [Chloroflexi bacterium]|nr:MAG: hypothetical protein D6768_08845 [Chloroflexota bacterium]
MTTETNAKKQIYQIIESLPVERLPDLLHFLKQFLQLTKSEVNDAAPIYQIYHHAVDTGIPDLAAQHDHYLYGMSKHDA